MKLYYAHCMAIYDTPQEERDVAFLESIGFEVFNPNCPRCKEEYDHSGMSYFTDIVKECDGIAFRALPDGRITAGVCSEIMANGDRPLIELPGGLLSRGMSWDETKEYLREVGQR